MHVTEEYTISDEDWFGCPTRNGDDGCCCCEDANHDKHTPPVSETDEDDAQLKTDS